MLSGNNVSYSAKQSKEVFYEGAGYANAGLTQLTDLLTNFALGDRGVASSVKACVQSVCMGPMIDTIPVVLS